MFLAGATFEDESDEEPRRSETEPPEPASRRSFGDFEGAFHSEIEDEDQKINVLRLDSVFSGAVFATLLELRVMLEDPRYAFVFERENAHGERPTPADLATYVRDWVDADETNALLDPTSQTNPFGQGFGDEKGPYSRLDVKYVPKNAMFDTVDELYMVAGIGDRFMTAFADRLTIYSGLSGKLNINTDDPLQMVINILVAARKPDDPALRNPVLLATIIEEIKLAKMFSPFFGLSLGTFVSILEANRIEVNPLVKVNSASNTLLGDTSDTFRITATGEAGAVTKTLTAVVRYDDKLGRLMYWRED
jgi:general secretion pathway protein K